MFLKTCLCSYYPTVLLLLLMIAKIREYSLMRKSTEKIAIQWVGYDHLYSNNFNVCMFVHICLLCVVSTLFVHIYTY